MRNILSIVNQRKRIPSPSEQSSEMDFRSSSKAHVPNRDSMKQIICSLSPRTMKNYSSNCHCVSQGSKCQTSIRKLPVSSSTQSLSNKVCAKDRKTVLQLPSFFKIALLVLLCHTVPASSSPLLLRNLPLVASQASLQSKSLLESKGRNAIGNAIDSEKINEESFNVQTAKVFLEKVLLRKSRSTSSKCISPIQFLSSLADHAYSVANKARKQRKRKRNTYRTMANRSWEKKCKYTHEELKRLYCSVDRVPRMFGVSTQQVTASLRSMIFLLQDEMNILNVQYIGLEQCDARSPRYSQNKVLNDLFALKIELSEICPK